jgi:hypothetical protein
MSSMKYISRNLAESLATMLSVKRDTDDDYDDDDDIRVSGGSHDVRVVVP